MNFYISHKHYVGVWKIKSILIIEDDISLSNGIVLALKDDATGLIQAHNISQAKVQMRNNTFDLVLLDINLPDGNGLDFLSKVRTESTVPIILLTANDMETDIVTGLELGADDYITKPFSLMVLRARVNARLRSEKSTLSNIVRIDDFSFSFDNMTFSKSGMMVELSKTEQRLLRVLLENKGHTTSRSDLVDRVWTDSAEYVDENALCVTVKRLRDKLENNPSLPQYIKTVYGIGYTWAV